MKSIAFILFSIIFVSCGNDSALRSDVAELGDSVEELTTLVEALGDSTPPRNLLSSKCLASVFYGVLDTASVGPTKTGILLLGQAWCFDAAPDSTYRFWTVVIGDDSSFIEDGERINGLDLKVSFTSTGYYWLTGCGGHSCSYSFQRTSGQNWDHHENQYRPEERGAPFSSSLLFGIDSVVQDGRVPYRVYDLIDMPTMWRDMVPSEEL